MNLLEHFENQQPTAPSHHDIQLQLVKEFLAEQQLLQRASEEEEEEEDRIGQNYATTSTSDALAQCILMSGINEADAGAQPL